MSSKLAVLLVILLVAAGCSGGSQVSPPTAVSSSTTSSVAPPTGTTEGPSTSTTEPRAGVSPELQAEIDELVAATERIRELVFLQPPNVVVVTEDELADRVRALIEEELTPEELERDTAALALLGILEEGRDLRQLYLDLYSGVVAGYYDPEVGELVVPATDGALTATQRITLVHELTHALTDQHFRFGELGEQLDDEQRYEEALALSGVVEGDATLTELLYFNTLSPGDQQAVLRDSGGDPNALAGVPRYIQELLFFPYTTGAEFVVELWRDGGFSAVDDAYRNPPTTSEQVLDGDAYRSGEVAATVDLRELDLDGYELGESGVWGEAGLSAMLGQHLAGGLTADAADGWGGDRYQIYFDGENVVFVFSYVGDRDGDAEELARAVVAYNDAAISGDDYRFVEQTGDRLVWILADDPEVGAMVQALVAP